MARVFQVAALLLVGLYAVLPAEEVKESPVLPGHSAHGEVFNEGPRQKAYLMNTVSRTPFPVTTKVPLVQAFVEQGVAQVHGYWYFEAERSFRQAATLDPDCAIAYWGMALANFKNAKRAKGFLAEAVERKDRASKREAMYIDALNIYFNGKGNADERMKNYVKALHDISRAYPDDIEALALYGHELYQNRAKLKKSYEEVEGVLQLVLAREPMHPVHHYIIHLWDNKDPKRALASAAQCGQSAPGIAHMWHMPGHTYSKLKRYEDAVWQQEASARVDHAHMMRDGVMPDQIHNFAHNNEWLIRNLINIGRVDDAVALAKNMIELPRHPKYNTLTKGSANFGRQRLFEVLVRYELWGDLLALAEAPYLEPTDRETEQIKRLYHVGVAAAQTGKLDLAREALADLEKQLEAKKKAEAAKKNEPKKEEPKEEPKKDEPKEGDPKGDEPRKDEPGREEPRKDEPKEQEPKKEEPKPAPRQQPGRPRVNPEVQQLTRAIAAIKGHLAVGAKDYKEAIKQLRAGGEDGLYIASIQARAGETDAAIKAAQAYVNSRENQVQPLAGLIEIFWHAGKKEEARKSFDDLRRISGSIQFGSPVFARLAPIAKELGLPEDWRVKQGPLPDTGDRPDLADLGPFRWQPSPAPEWELLDASGSPHRLRDYHGKPVVVIFYLGYGCLHCAEQIEAFAKVTEQFRDAGIEVIGISTDDLDGLKVSLEKYKGGAFPFPLVSNAKLEVFKTYRAFDDFENLPLHGTFLIDPQGMVRWQDTGAEPFMDAGFLLTEAKRLLAK
jgi:peroxiredoxin